MEDAQDEDMPENHKAGEIQAYLNTFRKEILATTDEDETEKNEEATECEQESQKYRKSQDLLMYFTSTDGTLYSTNVVQPALPQAVTVASDLHKENGTSDEGLQHLVVTLGESSIVLNDPKALSYSLPNTGTQQGGTPLIADDPYQTVTVVPSDTNPGQLNYVLFVSNIEGLDTKAETNATKLLTIDGKVTDEKTNVCEMPSEHIVAEYTCQYCDYTSSKRYLLSRHMKCHSDERPHKCKVCERGFKTVSSLQNHVNTHTKTRPHHCRECDSTFTTSGELVRHMRYKHTHERPHRCTECDYASVELSKLKRHMRCHTGERPYQCSQCTYASPDTYKLKRHLRTHTGEKPYACDVCQARFTQSNSLKAHQLIHSGNKPAYQCVYCPATCGRKTDLRIHVQKLHSADKKHTCKQCGKVFKDKYSFKVHCKTHDGEKTYKCNDCPFVTISLPQFEAHVVTHENEGFYQCTECAENFSHKQLLAQHITYCHESKSVTSSEAKAKDIVCPECGKAFRYHENMVRHTAIHDPDSLPEKREEAMQIGRPKKPGEFQDGEEDELNTDENFESDQDFLELMNMQKFSDGENKVISIANGQFLTLTGNNNEYAIPHSSGENVQTVISSVSGTVEDDDESQVPLRIEFEGESSDSSANGNEQLRRSRSKCNVGNNQNLCKLNKAPQIIQKRQ